MTKFRSIVNDLKNPRFHGHSWRHLASAGTPTFNCSRISQWEHLVPSTHCIIGKAFGVGSGKRGHSRNVPLAAVTEKLSSLIQGQVRAPSVTFPGWWDLLLVDSLPHPPLSFPNGPDKLNRSSHSIARGDGQPLSLDGTLTGGRDGILPCSLTLMPPPPANTVALN